MDKGADSAMSGFRTTVTVHAYEDGRTEVWTSWEGRPIVVAPGHPYTIEFSAAVGTVPTSAAEAADE